VTDISCEDVRVAFEEEHPKNMVDASDAYALSVFPFGLGGGLRYFCTNGWAKQKALR
jgi:hypothetical protein